MSIKSVLTLIINHNYYRNACCKNFLIQADTLTDKFFKKNRMVIRYIQNSWKVFTDIEYRSLWVPMEFDNDIIYLKFTLSSSDENFYHSINDQNSLNGIHCICNKQDEIDLQACSCTESDCKNWSKQLIPLGKLKWVICLKFSRSTFLDTDKNYTVNFNVKDVYWKYYVFNSNGHDNIAIIDADSKVNFLTNIKEVFPYDKKALTFISDKKLPLSESDAHNFRLITKKGSIERNLIKRLPVATATGVQFKDTSKKDFMSLIFVNI